MPYLETQQPNTSYSVSNLFKLTKNHLEKHAIFTQYFQRSWVSYRSTSGEVLVVISQTVFKWDSASQFILTETKVEILLFCMLVRLLH